MKYETRTTAVTVAPVGEPIFSESATVIRIADEAVGEYIEIEQISANGVGKIVINPYEWPTVRAAIDSMIRACRDSAKQDGEALR